MNKKIICIMTASLLLLSGCGKFNNTLSASPVANKQVLENNSNIVNEKKEQVDPSLLSKKNRDWGFKSMSEGVVSEEPQELINLLNKYSSYYVGDTTKKELYLTFDEGYENGYTATILDALKKNQVKAAFFVTLPYIKSNPELIKRMVAEGHLVCNHSNTHPAMSEVAIKDKSKFDKEFTDVEKIFEEVTGKKMPKYFRPPQGKYNELSLYYTKTLGYKTIFWSCAYDDWDVKKQRTPDYAKNIINKRTHNGAIVLLHAVSKTNADTLDSIVKDWRAKGYELKSLEALPNK